MPITSEYRETNTGDYYIIRFERRSDGVWRIFADLHPHNPFNTSVHQCHLYDSKEICVDHSKYKPRTLDQAKACAVMWMEGYSQYVRTGRFLATGGRVKV